MPPPYNISHFQHPIQQEFLLLLFHSQPQLDLEHHLTRAEIDKSNIDRAKIKRKFTERHNKSDLKRIAGDDKERYINKSVDKIIREKEIEIDKRWFPHLESTLDEKIKELRARTDKFESDVKHTITSDVSKLMAKYKEKEGKDGDI